MKNCLIQGTQFIGHPGQFTLHHVLLCPQTRHEAPRLSILQPKCFVPHNRCRSLRLRLRLVRDQPRLTIDNLAHPDA